MVGADGGFSFFDFVAKKPGSKGRKSGMPPESQLKPFLLLRFFATNQNGPLSPRAAPASR
jgi:hypothetical protein